MRGTLEYIGQKLDVRILDISKTGMALQLEGWVEAKRGAMVAVRCAELGHIECTVRWYRAGKWDWNSSRPRIRWRRSRPIFGTFIINRVTLDGRTPVIPPRQP